MRGVFSVVRGLRWTGDSSGNAGTGVIDEEGMRYYFFVTQYYEADLATNVTVKGQVTLPKAVREAASIRPGDRVNVRVRPKEG
jgi:AbrB family looped-hinge helix DNA binding protein